jgi:predicted transcriptional regulator
MRRRSQNMSDSEIALLEWQIAAIKEGIAAADRGDLIPHEDVKVWAASLGANRKLPLPRPRR